MIRLAISVEGQTEEEFVKEVLTDHLQGSRVEPTPILLGRARSGSGGGNVSVERLASEMFYLFNSFDAVTSLVDFYGFRGKGSAAPDELTQRIDVAIGKKIRGPRYPSRVFAYVQRYEFEGLLFSNVDAFKLIGVSNESVQTLRNIRSQFLDPEEINDSYTTAPSKRIVQIAPRYKKEVHGPLLAMEIGLAAIRAECPRFDAWVTRLESLGSPN